MMFRKLYWVTEEVAASGAAHLLGVFTSIPNLLRNGLPENGDLSCFRLTLTKLDCEHGPLASWSGDRFEKLGRDLAQFVATEDITEDQRNALVQAIDLFRSAPVLRLAATS